ncbi:unnamed protein product [Trifolium pratense]|uniref:Uncharacterized protein n=1 Tax=Trifolium pratense TaxID=57577 RepID=A0ACB0L5U6_TRIPR|nr:unnamed protein product [Trifolium pratense]
MADELANLDAKMMVLQEYIQYLQADLADPPTQMEREEYIQYLQADLADPPTQMEREARVRTVVEERNNLLAARQTLVEVKHAIAASQFEGAGPSKKK